MTNPLALDLGLHLKTSEPDFRLTLAEANEIAPGAAALWPAASPAR